jgi:predicted nucleic acid-binding protein
MPSGKPEIAVLDTSVYVDNFRTGRFTDRIIESPFLLRGVSVVIHELLRGARRAEEQEFAVALSRRLRLYTPTERIWFESGTIVAQVATAKGYDARKIRELSFDALIALTARSIGATVITLNRQDFDDIRSFRRFRVIFWE